MPTALQEGQLKVLGRNQNFHHIDQSCARDGSDGIYHHVGCNSRRPDAGLLPLMAGLGGSGMLRARNESDAACPGP